MSATKPLSLRVPAARIKELDGMAARRGLTRAALASELLERGLLASSLDEIAQAALSRIAAAQRSDAEILDLLALLIDKVSAIESELPK